MNTVIDVAVINNCGVRSCGLFRDTFPAGACRRYDNEPGCKSTSLLSGGTEPQVEGHAASSVPCLYSGNAWKNICGSERHLSEELVMVLTN
jgi:hypothetical protein